jgi:hypothetical protein
MEAAGLTLSVAGLAALFGSCIEAWGYISSARSFPQDFAIQQTKLDIEKTIFLQWARSVGIITAEGEGYQHIDQRLADENADILPAVMNVLWSLKTLLTNSEELRLKYGVENDDSNAAVNEDDRICATLMRTFEVWQQRLQAHQAGASPWTKTRWACRDRDRFAALVNEISYFVSKLQALTPIAPFLEQLMVRQVIDGLQADLPRLRLVRDASVTWHQNWSEVASESIAASAAAGSNAGTEIGNDYEHVQDWRRAVPSEGTPVPQPQQILVPPAPAPELLAVDADMVETVKSAMKFCDDLPSILNDTFDDYKEFGNSAAVSSVKMKLKIHLKDLRLLRLTPEKLRSLKEGLDLWDEENQRIAARLRSKTMKTWSRRQFTFFGMPWEWDWEGRHDFQMAFQGIPTGLELVMKNVR